MVIRNLSDIFKLIGFKIHSYHHIGSPQKLTLRESQLNHMFTRHAGLKILQKNDQKPLNFIPPGKKTKEQVDKMNVYL